MAKPKQYFCTDCDAEFKLSHDMDPDYFTVSMCPFCGAEVEHEEEDYESLDSVHEIENSDYVEKDKVIVTSLNEYLNNEIEVVEEQSQDI